MIGKVIKYCFIGLIVLVALFGAQKIYNLFYENQKLHEDLLNTQQKYEQLSKDSAKLEIDYKNEKELQALLEKDWAKEKAKLEGKVKILAQAVFSTQEKERVTDRSDIVYKGPYVLNEIKFSNDGPPIGYVLMRQDGKVASKLYNYQIEVNTVVSKDDTSGRYNIVSKADYVLKETPKVADNKTWQDKKYPLDIIGGTAVIDPVDIVTVPTARFYLFAPRIGGGTHIYIDNIVPYFGLSLMGIGVSKRDLSWKFAEFGLEYSKDTKIAFSFAPIMYRPLKDWLPNTYLSAGITWTTLGSKKYFIGLNVGF